MRRARIIALAGALVPMTALACGACDEDKIAATYDHAVVSTASAKRQVVVFSAVEGAGDAKALARELRMAATRVRGIERGSVRVSVEPLAVSFALDAAAQTPEAAVAAVARATGRTDVKLTTVRVIR